ncbi:MAG TPA: hypothetical protein VK612_07245 [Pyrinomonadaceae bacterium]|nr:hypothetical protein [Pyrinomonadaceae bacterium]
MKDLRAIVIVLAVGILAVSAYAQVPIVINDPAIETPKSPISEADKALLDSEVLPKVRKALVDDACTDGFDPAGAVSGSFTRPGATQTLVFYQFCQTGNGLGQVGIAILEEGKVVGSYTADSGWSDTVKVLPDINDNGLNEFALYYSGGMHQGEGGTGVDIMEFGTGGPKALGWFQASAYFAEADSLGWKVTVKKRKTPVFYREKYLSSDEKKWRKAGKAAAFTLKKTENNFVAVK